MTPVEVTGTEVTRAEVRGRQRKSVQERGQVPELWRFSYHRDSKSISSGERVRDPWGAGRGKALTRSDLGKA